MSGQSSSDTERCWRCGRAASMPTSKDEYLFGSVCDRAECKRVKQAFLDEYKRFWAAASLPVDGPGSGRPSAWSPDGRITSCGALDGDGQVNYPTPETAEILADGGVERQTALTSHAGREIAKPVRDDERNVRCPDCEQVVSASKGSHPAPDDAPTERIWGWQCGVCENTLPSNALQKDAPMFNDRITAVRVTFRDDSERLVPAPKTHVKGGESACR